MAARGVSNSTIQCCIQIPRDELAGVSSQPLTAEQLYIENYLGEYSGTPKCGHFWDQ